MNATDRDDTAQKIAEIREALEKATPGKWKYMPSIHSEFAYEVCVATFFDPILASIIRKEDANLVANAPEWLRFLLEERNKLIEGLRSIRKELDRRFRESDQKWEREADMYEQGKSAAYDEADSLICDILREIGVNVDGDSHPVV